MYRALSGRSRVDDPRLMHFLEVSALTMNIPTTNRGMVTKHNTIQSIIYDILTTSVCICGYRFCFKGNITFAECCEMAKSYKITEGISE